MKQFLRIALAALLFLTLSACGESNTAAPAEPEPLNLAGEYRLTQMIDSKGSDITSDISMLEERGRTVTLLLNEDGTGTFDMFGEVSDVTWTESEIVIDGEYIPLTIEDGVLTLKKSDGAESRLVFTPLNPPQN